MSHTIFIPWHRYNFQPEWSWTLASAYQQHLEQDIWDQESPAVG